MLFLDFYPRPPRGGRRGTSKSTILLLSISIHALREEGDTIRRCSRCQTPISIHALREEGDPPAAAPVSSMSDFYPRPPRGGRRIPVVSPVLFKDISIHALREEGDVRGLLVSIAMRYFYPRPPRGGRRMVRLSRQQKPQFLSTPSARRATRFSYDLDELRIISIHALREEGDLP